MTTSARKFTARERDAPAYTIAEAARYLRLPSATLRSWVLGRECPTTGGAPSFRRSSGPLRGARRCCPSSISSRHMSCGRSAPITRTGQGGTGRPRLCGEDAPDRPTPAAAGATDGCGANLLERYGELIELSASGQLAMRRLFSEHLKRVEWDASRFPVRLYPFLPASLGGEDHTIAIDPRIAFGRPVILRKGISTAVIAERIDAGELPGDVAADYAIRPTDIEEAVLYERAA